MKTLTQNDYIKASEDFKISIPLIKTVAEVESNGKGFLKDGRPIILFEGHKFSEFTNHKYDCDYPTISYPEWTKEHYLGGSKEYIRYFIASTLDYEATLKSTSFGLFQIMGFNYDVCGYKTVYEFVYDMQLDEAHHLKAFLNFIKNKDLVKYLIKHDWKSFAYHYNGAGYAKNKYHLKLAKAYKKHSKSS